ncbi:CheB methylesterase domain-containing protein [Ohessyouella blattaphilus]|uniref:protein-glutamate methylesterase n=1 Tax=Ohessyouella blattaphilus TaxID=2949333 RepID=A0ABT1EEJ7_9FIRM|nr:CheB methylesterase domain-containing protein [Ohessyouella blattaphilus]MCP1109105.1 CheB methylesterase domain-containing protein [Ohessyouella blattaphilus]MCR8562499.1 CheB methylesterase domain-containing protein [Ohessyouella blattaphilus]
MFKNNLEIIAIGASTGGTEATVKILEALPAAIPAIVITQHMPEGFTQMYAQRLDKICNFQVKEARDGDCLTPGLCLVAPGGQTHMKIVRIGPRYFVRLLDEEKVNCHRPSVDVLFHSVAKYAGPNALGVILTGMGSDGAKGLLEMKKAGAYTIGQDKASSVVYGMPMVAHDLGALCTQAPLDSIANLIINRL